MNRIAGAVYLPDSASPLSKNSDLTNAVAYVAQTAWLTNATIRENIIFGEEFDSARYERVIKDCALVKDFQTLAGGDLTEIGEKGINLSGTIIYNAGGQKQRISLARACYSRAGFVLLDDPLSAVDAPTAKYLLQQCILGCLRGRTCILVSHAVALVVPYADYCIVVKNGEIACQGSPESIVANPEADGLFGLSLQAELLEEQEDLTNKHPVAAGLGTGTALVQAEEKADGSVRWDIYKNYFLASGGILFIVLFISSFFIVSMAKVGNDWWLKHWTDSANLPLAFNHTEAIANPVSNYGTNSEYVKSRVNNFMQNSVLKDAYPAIDDQGSNALFYVGIYAIFGVSVMLANNLQIGIVLGGSWIGSRNIHRKLLDSILGAPLRFFETTPIGRVLNRFSKDIENVDMMVMESVEYFISRIISGATIVAVIGSVVPPFLIAIPPIIFLYKQIAQKYLKTSRELKRIESVTRSPIYAQFSETLSGVATIRAYGVQKRFSDNIRNMVDANHQSFFYIWAANRWLCLRTDILSGLVVFFSGIAVIVSGVEPGWAALTITYALDFTNVLLWTVRTHAEMEMAMNSVERIEEYMAIEQEPPAIIEGRRPDANWPANGAVKVDGLSIRYAPDQADVLRNVSFEILAHEKLAVVGRTGAGKSTLSLAFFRILPLSGGSITIDGIDINDIGLLDLRSRLTVIPQDPVLFTGTVRTNLDPLEERTDQELWDALDRAHLSDSLQKSNIDNDLLDPAAFTLDYAVTENGANFSQGQRQLLCLARALLRGSRIVFLDEATASVDNETDMKIQKTIRQEFKSSTVVCIAHRLRTVIDYDKILVLDKGRVVEFGAPSDLINTKQGAFRAMCEETGEFEELVQLASAGKFQ